MKSGLAGKRNDGMHGRVSGHLRVPDYVEGVIGVLVGREGVVRGRWSTELQM